MSLQPFAKRGLSGEKARFGVRRFHCNDCGRAQRRANTSLLSLFLTINILDYVQ
jgi:hypothetical protein